MAAENETEVKPDLADEKLSKDSEKLMDNLFGGAPAEDSSEEEVEETEEEIEEESSEEESPEDEEEDWDSSPDKKKKTKDDEDDDDVDLKDESVARKEAKKRGREAKELKQKLQETELEVTRIKDEAAELKKRLEEVEAVNVKPEDHKEFKKLRKEILDDVKDASETLTIPNPEDLVRNFGPFIVGFNVLSGLEGQERTEARSALREQIADKLKLTDTPYAELDEDERKALLPTINEVFKVIQRNVGKHKELNELHTSLEQKGRTGRLALGVREYQAAADEFNPILEAVGNLEDDVIDADPHSVASVVARMVKKSPDAKKRLEKARAEVLEVLIGPRALTQKEIETIEANGTPIKEYLAERSRNHKAKQKKFAAFFLQGLMTRPVIKETLAKLAKYEKTENDEDSELDILTKTGKKKKATTTKDSDLPPSKRANPVDKLFS